MHFLFQTSINAPRQKTQAIIKQAAAKAGIEIELKSVPASVFFAGDPGNTDTDSHFYADMEEYANRDDARPRRLDAAIRVHGGLAEGQQVVGPEQLALAERRVRRPVQAGASRSSTPSSAPPCSSG